MNKQGSRREWLRNVIFESDTAAGRGFDVALFWAIVGSIAVAVFDSVGELHARWGLVLIVLEWSFTVLFTVEYVVRVAVVERRRDYVLGTWGLIDLVAILPSWLSLLVPGTQSLLVVRSLRLLRVFRVLRMAGFVREAQVLRAALMASTRKITVFLGAVLAIVVIVGSLMYTIEGEAHGFTSIPVAMYWAIVTLSTVGYGDIAPGTPLGKLVASLLMVVGYGLIAVPTGIVSVEIAQASKVKGAACGTCGRGGHADDAKFCSGCGTLL